MWKRYVYPIRSENFWRSTNRERVILPSSQAKFRKNTLFIDQSAFSNFALFVIKRGKFLEKVSEQSVNEAVKIKYFSTPASNKHSPLNVCGGSFDTRCTTFTFCTLSSAQRQAYLPHLHVRCTIPETLYGVKIFVVQATQLAIEWGIPSRCSARTFLLSRQTLLPFTVVNTAVRYLDCIINPDVLSEVDCCRLREFVFRDKRRKRNVEGEFAKMCASDRCGSFGDKRAVCKSCCYRVEKS